MGWEPRRWTVIDEDGAQVTTTEAEWDDYERDKMIALDLYDEAVCSGCGVHTSRMRKDVDFYTFETKKCPTCAGADMFTRRITAQDHVHEESIPDSYNEIAKAALSRPSDGRKIYLKPQSAVEAASAPARDASTS